MLNRLSVEHLKSKFKFKNIKCEFLTRTLGPSAAAIAQTTAKIASVKEFILISLFLNCEMTGDSNQTVTSIAVSNHFIVNFRNGFFSRARFCLLFILVGFKCGPF